MDHCVSDDDDYSEIEHDELIVDQRCIVYQLGWQIAEGEDVADEILPDLGPSMSFCSLLAPSRNPTINQAPITASMVISVMVKGERVDLSSEESEATAGEGWWGWWQRRVVRGDDDRSWPPAPRLILFFS